MSEQQGLRFEFGKNWSNFVRRNLSDERVDIARKHILSFIQRDRLDGLDFLDIGCGSGLHSAAALRAGAGKICSFDYDPNSVNATNMVREHVGAPANWQVMRGDALDADFMNSLGKWSFVYSWGVLHHTGDVWRAVDNASKTVADGGMFYLALYAADVQTDPEFWLRIKREYNEASEWKRRKMVWWYVWVYMMNKNVLAFPHVLWRMARHRMTRGMSLFVDIRDWLGGWPMEFTYDADVIKFLDERGFSMKNIKTGQACTEFLFAKRA
jgi:SAM-dependent methyltransferase